MSLVTDIKDIVKDIKPDSTFKLSSYFKANVNAHSIKKENLPYIVLDNEFKKTVQIMKNLNLQKLTRIRIYFLDLDKPHNTDEERETIRQSMEDIADRAMVRIFQLSYVRVVGTANQQYITEPVFNAFASQLSGVYAEMSANINELVNWC